MVRKDNIGLFTVCFAAVFAIASVTNSKDIGTLKVTASVTGSHLILRNNTGGTLTDCHIVVNDRFETWGVNIPVGGQQIRWPSLMTKSDVRFDPALDDAKRVHVLCREGDVALVE